MPVLPSGTVTFLFTDIEGSTQLWERYPTAMKAALARHDAILREAVAAHGGHTIKTTGDGIHAVFATAVDSIGAVIAGQQSLLEEDWGEVRLNVRMGLHTGEAEVRADDYFGATLNRAARLMSAAHGGQILVSNATAELVSEHLPQGAGLLDLGEHHLKDLARAERIFQLTHPSLPGQFPPIRSSDSFPNNLPVQLNSFIGRERELAEAKKKLLPSTPGSDGARLLTLIGPGGTGKTRLSLQIASDLLPGFADGAWLVELAPLSDPAQVPQGIASALGVREQMGMPLLDIIVNYLRAKKLLLILDNCEHLVEACAKLADEFLHASPQLKIIASSREALGIGGETVYRVPSLSLPGEAQPTLEALRACESAQLFVERALAANPKFALTDRNAAAVSQICRRLDGIPLALELAAARITLLSAEQIAARLDDRFKLLTGGSRTALPRQQTLRALIDWSYDMLGEPERALLRRLSVFSGGWTFDAAEAVCPNLDVLELLAQLVNRSLVSLDEAGDEPRYSLLETIRQYARDKLMEAGESAETRNKHLAYFIHLSESAEQELFRGDAFRWVQRLEAEYDNYHAAIDWGMENDLLAVLRIAGALPNFWFRRGYEAQGRKWIEEALARAEALPTPTNDQDALERTRILAKAWQSVGFMAFSMGDTAAANTACANCATLARQVGDNAMLSIILIFEASARLMSGHFDKLDELINESLELARAGGDKYALGMSLGMLGSRMIIAGHDLETAQAYSQEALALLKDSDNRFGFLVVSFAMGMAARYQGHFDDARAQFERLNPLFLAIGDNHRANMLRSEIAHMERLEGQYEQARHIYRETIREWQRLGHRAAVAHQLECLATLDKLREQSERAVRLLGAAQALRERINIPMTAVEKLEYDREVADLRAGMDAKAFSGLWAEGRALSMEQAIELALQDPAGMH